MKKKPQLVLDTECYRDYWLAMFMSPDGRVKSFEHYDGHPLDREGLSRLLFDDRFEIVTFNGNNYDIPLVTLALSGASPLSIKQASDAIIVGGVKPWKLYSTYCLKQPDINHVDLYEVSPGRVGLKVYGARLHCEKLQDLPIDPSAHISPDDREKLKLYCRNDLVVTQRLAKALEKQIDLRRAMSFEYGVDLRSKSDAQIAEAVLKSEKKKLSGGDVFKSSRVYYGVTYEPPAYVKFITPYMKERLEIIRSVSMTVKDTGHVEMPKEIEEMDIVIGDNSYKIGIGGLHSQESSVAHFANDDVLLIDRDVESYYPNLMLNLGMYPDAIGEDFNTIYRNILDERLDAKHSGNKVKSDSLKITLNGTFGKTSSKYSVLYNPEMMIRTTLTGQLSLLMLIELLEHRGIPVISANTDGIVIKCPIEKEQLLKKCVYVWEKATNLKTEETRYSRLYSRDVNNYVAFKLDGSVKTKGVYAPLSLAKSPQNEICVDAVISYLRDGTPLNVTIAECTDIRKFLTLRKVEGGAFKEGYDLGKVVRWYYSTEETGAITYKTNGNTVPRSQRARPLMDLPSSFPVDVDLSWYTKEAESMLVDLGAVKKPALEKLPRKNTKAWKALEESGEIEQDRFGEWVWSNEKAHTVQ